MTGDWLGCWNEGVRLCRAMYEADRGSAGREALASTPEGIICMDERRLTLGLDGADDDGDRWDGGV